MKYKKTKSISFPLGGIGTGCIGLMGNGEIADWEIFNKPNKSSRNGYSHFAIKASGKGVGSCKVLHGDTNESYMGAYDVGMFTGIGFGPKTNSMAGYPHFASVSFEGDFPIAKLTFCDKEFPGKIRLTAFNPFIPHNELDSSLPVAMFSWEIENTTEENIDYTLCFTVQNPAPVSVNTEIKAGKYKGVFLESKEKSVNEIGYSDLTVLCDGENVNVTEYWYRGGWQDDPTTYWRDFSADTAMPARHYENAGVYDHATVSGVVCVPPKKKRTLRFVISWNVPNQYCYWREYKNQHGEDVLWKNYYATVFESSKKSCEYAMGLFQRLFKKSKEFALSIKNSALPPSVKDAVSANLSVLKSPTVLRLEDGSFWGWEGCMQTYGSCEGSCQHVWNYAYALPFLFPSLERSMRENTIKYALYPHGGTSFRVQLPLGREGDKFWRACVDGQMGEVIKCYREWKISGDTEWLRKYAPSIFSMLEYAWSTENEDSWDRNRDGVLEGRQHHTLDMELFGPSSWLQGFYLLALDCASEMALALKDTKRAEEYKEIYEKGKKWTNENLFNGKYFFHLVDLKDKSIIDSYKDTESYWNGEAEEIKYQVANGCIIDQLLADWHSGIIGKDSIFSADKKKTALEYLYENNFKKSMRNVTNMWRNFSLNDEGGVIICSYPKDEKAPAIPIPYCEETMTGFEYALAGLMIQEGFVQRGEEIVAAIRQRYDGEKRNPWNEIECGNNYARSMASYALMLIYSGFTFDMTKNEIGFNPVNCGRYQWSVGNTWGNVSLENERAEITVLGSSLKLSSIYLPMLKNVKTVIADGCAVDFTYDKGRIFLIDNDIKKSLVIIG